MYWGWMTKNFGQPRIIVLVVVSIIPQNIIWKCNSHEMVTFSRPPPILQKLSSHKSSKIPEISPWPPNPVVSNIIYRQNAKFSTMLHQDPRPSTDRQTIHSYVRRTCPTLFPQVPNQQQAQFCLQKFLQGSKDTATLRVSRRSSSSSPAAVPPPPPTPGRKRARQHSLGGLEELG